MNILRQVAHWSALTLGQEGPRRSIHPDAGAKTRTILGGIAESEATAT